MKSTKNKQSSDKNINTDKITSPINYPNSRSTKGNIAIPSESNTELSRNWIEMNKL